MVGMPYVLLSFGIIRKEENRKEYVHRLCIKGILERTALVAKCAESMANICIHKECFYWESY
jgi:hypothetical protein